MFLGAVVLSVAAGALEIGLGLADWASAGHVELVQPVALFNFSPFGTFDSNRIKRGHFSVLKLDQRGMLWFFFQTRVARWKLKCTKSWLWRMNVRLCFHMDTLAQNLALFQTKWKESVARLRGNEGMKRHGTHFKNNVNVRRKELNKKDFGHRHVTWKV